MDFISKIPTHMDFEGQARAEKLSRIIITLFGAVGLIWGYIIQQFSQTVYILGAGFVLAALCRVPTRLPLQFACCMGMFIVTLGPPIDRFPRGKPRVVHFNRLAPYAGNHDQVRTLRPPEDEMSFQKFMSLYSNGQKVQNGVTKEEPRDLFQLTIPPWPLYRRKPLNWQPAKNSNEVQVKDGSKKGKKK